MSGTRTIGVAIAVPDPFSAELHDWRERLGDPDAKQIPPHVTLLPPTALPVGEVDEVLEHLRAVADQGRCFRLQLRGSATFRPVSPVVFVQMVQGMAECALLERAVRSGPLARDLAFSYYPHVTVAHDLSDGELDRALTELETYDASFDVTALTLFERDRDGWWRPLHEFAFPAGLGAPRPG
ncbi:MAG: 2-5 ligase [Frankiales bacterium]|nr:2-5 ligase [Frankiales bacterium]